MDDETDCDICKKRPKLEGDYACADCRSDINDLAAVDTTEYEAECKKQEDADKKILFEVKKLLSEKDIEMLEEGFNDCMHVYSFEIVDSPEGEDQLEAWEHGTRFCSQGGGGFSGDYFSGDDYIPLPDNKFFKYSYNC